MGLLWLLNWLQYAERRCSIKYLCSHPALGVLFKKNCTYNYSAVTETSENVRSPMSNVNVQQLFIKTWKCQESSHISMKPNLASVPQHQINSQRWVLGEVEKNSFIALQGQGAAAANALKTVSQHGGGSAFTVTVQRGRDQLVDTLLIGWWWHKWESASPPFWFHWSGVYRLVGSIQLTSPTWWGCQSLQNSPKDCCMCPSGGTRTLTPGFHYCFSWLFLGCLEPLPCLISNYLNLSDGTQEG